VTKSNQAYQAGAATRAASVHVLDRDALQGRLSNLLGPRAAIVCMGSQLHGDDDAGMQVGRELAGELPWPVFEVANAPESFVAKIAGHQPETVIVIDAVDFGGEAGDVALIDIDRIADESASTHGPSPVRFLEALRCMHPCLCAVLGIQPADTGVGQPLGPPVRQAARRIADAFRAVAQAAQH